MSRAPFYHFSSTTGNRVATAAQEHTQSSANMSNPHIPNPPLFQHNLLSNFYNPPPTSSSQLNGINVPNHPQSASHLYSAGQRNTSPYGIGSRATATDHYANHSNSQAQQENAEMRDIFNPPPVGNTVPRSSSSKRGKTRNPRQRQPPPVLWDKHKSTIQALYIDQKMPLQDVIVEMRTKHGFNATYDFHCQRSLMDINIMS